MQNPVDNTALDKCVNYLMRNNQFNKWLNMLCWLSDELNKGLEEIQSLMYNQLYIVKLVEFITVGREYVLTELTNDKSDYAHACFEEIANTIDIIISQYSEDELIYLEYRRHNVCHIFQEGYDIYQQDGKIKNNKNVISKEIGTAKTLTTKELEDKFAAVLHQYGFPNKPDDNFDKTKRALIHPVLSNLRDKINEINLKERNRQPL